jgi:hypothetical protein
MWIRFDYRLHANDFIQKKYTSSLYPVSIAPYVMRYVNHHTHGLVIYFVFLLFRIAV